MPLGAGDNDTQVGGCILPAAKALCLRRRFKLGELLLVLSRG